MTPPYLQLARTGELGRRAELAQRGLRCCRLCPRNCGVDRLAGEQGLCHTGQFAQVSSVFAHHGEEVCLSGRRGSGTIFFAHCNLRCVFCQNADISQGAGGSVCPDAELAGLMVDLQRRGCHNLNLVTPSHVVAQILVALPIAVARGFSLPIVYNTGGYDGLETLRLLDGVVDIYLPDFKVWSSRSAARLSKAKDYPAVARVALREMHRQVGPLDLGSDGLARRGVLVRHLVMPGHQDEACEIFLFLASQLSPDTYVNIMDQYRPRHRAAERRQDGTWRYPELARGTGAAEVSAAFTTARAAGLHRFDGA